MRNRWTLAAAAVGVCATVARLRLMAALPGRQNALAEGAHAGPRRQKHPQSVNSLQSVAETDRAAMQAPGPRVIVDKLTGSRGRLHRRATTLQKAR